MSKEDDIRLDQKVRAAWMYYIAGLNQSEIASQLGTSRPVVQRLIAAAKEEGIVSINLHHPVANCLDYAQLLQENTGLSSAIWSPPLAKKAPSTASLWLLSADGSLSAG
jgi:DNA-binding transcriptional regulator LsrR (DeoR family)